MVVVGFVVAVGLDLTDVGDEGENLFLSELFDVCRHLVVAKLDRFDEMLVGLGYGVGSESKGWSV